MAKDIAQLYTDHVHKVGTGTIVRMHGQVIEITENIDRALGKKVDEFLIATTRSFKDRMQRVSSAVGFEIGFLYKKQAAFERGIAELALRDAELAAYLREARVWGDTLIHARNELEHNGWRLPRIAYAENAGIVTASEPLIEGLPVTTFVAYMTDRLMCFVEEVTVHCIQRCLPPALSITEIPLPVRSPTMPKRFQATLSAGGMPVWLIAYHASTFEAT